MGIGARLVAAAAITVAAGPVAAEPVAVDLPAGRVGQQIIALGRSARVSIVVPDAKLWNRQMPAVRRPMTVAAALAAIARRADAQLEQLGPDSWRLVPRRIAARPAKRRAPPPRTPVADDPSIPEVVVTASKRDVTSSRFPGQVTRVEGRDLELGGAGGTDRLAQRMTTIASTYLGAGRNKLFIRGIADSSFTGPTQATVGQYFGDLRLSYNAPDPDLRLADLAAVEVLAGPQGTLYGAGSLGGLIRLVPNPVDLSRSAGSVVIGAAATQHGAPGGDALGVINLPVVADRVGLRLVATAATEGGYIDKPLLGRTDVNRTNIVGGRATLRVALADRWSAELIGIGQRIRGADSQYADREGPPLTRAAPIDEGFRADFLQGQIVVSGALGAVRLRSSTGITAHDLMERYDATPPGGPVQLFAQANRTRMFANETRAWRSSSDGSGWLAGFSYVSNRSTLTRLTGTPDALRPSTGVTNDISEVTLYAEGSIRPLPGVLATGGLRATHALLDGASEDVPVPVSARLITARRAQTALLPAASALIDLNARASLFLRYQQGFRPGGLAIENEFVRRFRGDRVATIEAGLRTRQSGGGQLDAALTIAHTRWRDIQADFIDGAGLPSTANVGDGSLWTLEASSGAWLTSEIRFDAGVSLNHGRIDDPARIFSSLVRTNAADFDTTRAELLTRLRQIPNIARVTARAGLIYRRRFDDRRDVQVDAWVRYVGPSRLGVGPALGRDQGDYLDNGVTARFAIGAIGVSSSITNIADARGNRFALGTPVTTGRDQVTPLRPRTLRVGVDFSF